ncbi:predicted protein [Phaeodactylum tricornutum CCAP 1055/1]|uniref:Uncharacterized protein n=1 Tax=Phaeodactylum tricornutum (strain CCAP 1055/1) TaxID=556484 RepID=B7G4X1_PHATC|nr:predicted protein [Phaeodactylum tricornutum CCAP 1055/1]EEC46050.1 predicted protein [Phaeodactylum tricornutum CCAP 1055/1]|eukprot:XP_002182149.1 predicted protein [Phaeodactylum tricornutum CCAP 1055/1]
MFVDEVHEINSALEQVEKEIFIFERNLAEARGRKQNLHRERQDAEDRLAQERRHREEEARQEAIRRQNRAIEEEETRAQETAKQREIREYEEKILALKRQIALAEIAKQHQGNAQQQLNLQNASCVHETEEDEEVVEEIVEYITDDEENIFDDLNEDAHDSDTQPPEAYTRHAIPVKRTGSGADKSLDVSPTEPIVASVGSGYAPACILTPANQPPSASLLGPREIHSKEQYYQLHQTNPDEVRHQQMEKMKENDKKRLGWAKPSWANRDSLHETKINGCLSVPAQVEPCDVAHGSLPLSCGGSVSEVSQIKDEAPLKAQFLNEPASASSLSTKEKNPTHERGANFLSTKSPRTPKKKIVTKSNPLTEPVRVETSDVTQSAMSPLCGDSVPGASQIKDKAPKKAQLLKEPASASSLSTNEKSRNREKAANFLSTKSPLTPKKKMVTKRNPQAPSENPLPPPLVHTIAEESSDPVSPKSLPIVSSPTKDFVPRKSSTATITNPSLVKPDPISPPSPTKKNCWEKPAWALPDEAIPDSSIISDSIQNPLLKQANHGGYERKVFAKDIKRVNGTFVAPRPNVPPRLAWIVPFCQEKKVGKIVLHLYGKDIDRLVDRFLDLQGCCIEKTGEELIVEEIAPKFYVTSNPTKIDSRDGVYGLVQEGHEVFEDILTADSDFKFHIKQAHIYPVKKAKG